MKYENAAFYKQWKELKPDELDPILLEFLESGKITEDMDKNCNAKREFITSCVHPLRLHYSKSNGRIYLAEAELQIYSNEEETQS